MLSTARLLLKRGLSTSSRLGAVNMSTFYELSAEKLDGKTVQLSKYKGKVVLVLNTATL